jgi:G3E family GTPase
MQMKSPVPFYVLCGALGAGKTTLLMRLLEYWKQQGHRTGVLMNEAGEVSIDGPRAGTLAEQVLNLAGGCVCCDTKEDLSWGIAQLVQDYESDVIVLECSGMADPAEVVDGLTDVYVTRLAKLERIIALLHPVATQDGTIADLVTKHAIRYADDLILNKHDLYVPGHWEQFKSAILQQNPYARLWETSHARLDIAALLQPLQRAPQPAPLNVEFGKPPAPASKRPALHHPMVLTVTLPGSLNRLRFLRWVKHLPQGLERAKGFIRFTKEPELQEFQFSPPRTSTIAPVTLLDEPEPAIVLIGRGYDHERCRAALLRCIEQQ